MSIIKMFLPVVAGYLIGSIPFDFIAAKLFKGIDLRRFGSGTPSGSMLYEHVRHWLVVPVGILDVAKAALPTYLALKLGFGTAVAAAAGIAAMIGHNWPIFLRFTGGRGISTLLGVLVVLFPWGDVWLLGFLAFGFFLLKDSAPLALASITTMPVLVLLLGGSIILIWMIIAVLIVTLVKRLEANRRPLPPYAVERRRVIWMRLLLDRDMLDHKAWIRREL